MVEKKFIAFGIVAVLLLSLGVVAMHYHSASDERSVNYCTLFENFTKGNVYDISANDSTFFTYSLEKVNKTTYQLTEEFIRVYDKKVNLTGKMITFGVGLSWKADYGIGHIDTTVVVMEGQHNSNYKYDRVVVIHEDNKTIVYAKVVRDYPAKMFKYINITGVVFYIPDPISPNDDVAYAKKVQKLPPVLEELLAECNVKK